MNDTSLSDDRLKMVRYTVVSVKRDQERKLDGGEILVTDEMTPDGFASWRIAAYLQQPGHEEIPIEDEKYLRVCHEVLCRWPRESLHYQRRKLDALRGIAGAIEGSGASALAGPPELGEDEERVLVALRSLGGSAATGELTDEAELSRYGVRNALDTLIEAGLVRREGRGFDTRYVLEEEGGS